MLARLALHDPLTGSINRRCLEGARTRAVRRTARNGLPIGVIMLAVDNFKRCNDTLGHGAGDTLLLGSSAPALRPAAASALYAAKPGGRDRVALPPAI
jgi:diguanylate cyclase (GGDEF)-like protein